MASQQARPPAVSGAFYEADPHRLRLRVEQCFDHPVGPGRRPRPWGSRRVRALVVPHAGLIYSGPVAAHAYLRLAEACEPAVVVIVGPDHHGVGPSIALAPQTRWQTPLGEVVTDHPVKAALLSGGVPQSDLAHRHEHSVEVQLPFLQVLGYRGAVLPIVMADQDQITAWRLAEVLAGALAGLDATIIASSDLSHYLPYEQAVRVDRAALAALASGDARRLLREVGSRSISMCGAGPVAAVLEAARRLGAGPVEVLRYATSGDTAGDRDSVVGYAAASIEAA